MANTFKNTYVLQNPQKYVGQHQPFYRSSWEQAFMNHLDRHPNVLAWASEAVKIPYKNPFTGKNTIYVPDFFIVYVDKFGRKHVELIEIKPSKETFIEKAKSRKDQFAVALNTVKWQAAKLWCSQQGIGFRVLTEDQLFKNK